MISKFVDIIKSRSIDYYQTLRIWILISLSFIWCRLLFNIFLLLLFLCFLIAPLSHYSIMNSCFHSQFNWSVGNWQSYWLALLDHSENFSTICFINIYLPLYFYSYCEVSRSNFIWSSCHLINLIFLLKYSKCTKSKRK